MGDTPNVETTPNLDAYERMNGGQTPRQTTQQTHAEPGRTHSQVIELDDEFMEEFTATKDELVKARKEIDELKKTTGAHKQFTEGLKNLVSPDGGKETDPDQAELHELESSLDELIEEFKKAEASGRPMPLTQKTSKKSLTAAINIKKREIELKKKIEAMETKVDLLTDPLYAKDQDTYKSLGKLLGKQMDQLYGPGFENEAQKKGMSDAVVEQVNVEINRLKKEDPDAWRRVQGDETLQKNLVNYYVERNIPPKARQIMEEQKLRDTPITDGQLHAAFKEAKTLKDPKRREEMTTKIRREILSRRYGGKKGPLSSIGNG